MTLVQLNGRQEELSPGTTVAELVRRLAGGSQGVAVAVNRQVVPKSRWAATVVADGDRVEVLRAAQGG
jgi:sulfur carrier protein